MADVELGAALFRALKSMPRIYGCTDHVSVIRRALATLRQPYLGVIVYQMRAESELTQEELARRLGCSAGSVSAWESGSSTPANPGQYLLNLNP